MFVVIVGDGGGGGVVFPRIAGREKGGGATVEAALRCKEQQTAVLSPTRTNSKSKVGPIVPCGSVCVASFLLLSLHTGRRVAAKRRIGRWGRAARAAGPLLA